MPEEEIILVDENDNELGFIPKMEAHERGLLHRAFSVFVFNDAGEMLIQQRALDKYHSPGLWTNTCCSHPGKNEEAEKAAHRRLREEMGFDCELQYVYKFLYRAELENNLIEHELDHVFTGVYNQNPEPNAAEVAAYRWISETQLKAELNSAPQNFTYWFKDIMLRQEGKLPFPELNKNSK